MFSSARSFSKQVLNHRTQIQQQTKSQLRNQHNGPRAKDQQNNSNSTGRHDEDGGGGGGVSGRQVVLEKMRLENRERKKRWREVNEERNKDNDLRCRVNKRANQLYGAQPSEDKEKWIGEEFVRRQQRRRGKELRRRGVGLSKSPGTAATVTAPASSSQQQSQAPEKIPQGFGSYAALQPHQVSAAYGFWKSVAAQQALEESDPTQAPGSAGLRLPPLSSIVPEEYLPHRHRQHVAPPTAAGHAGMTAASTPYPLGTQNGHRGHHIRPWEEDEATGGGDGLTEAAFSLMSLSSNTTTTSPTSAYQ
ncbi:hypothetical protein IW140_005369 [Coemansia sp. RSA 1813]|nr:hypothetical protein EV178_005164 [Coemansia sp. RSA 1646]KAJ1769068.1 hypothetical protein LPJ74_004366 [Coemansia sp. RSA 1843]KAJ2086890.1 hypothetical protein IW138_005366 [Coemansia sp. RSA 986]KAJ2211672.1 hypothetical protein EV179_005286 [Coemansia sp. RSA 487]KAJ2565375.1 hypothetical protein IW140_005369 [Coemansia sp. RSA 1813]